MEAIVLLSLLTSLVVASLLWGYDSRETVRSKEQELASYGNPGHDLGADGGANTSTSVVLPANYAAGHLNGVHAR